MQASRYFHRARLLLLFMALAACVPPAFAQDVTDTVRERFTVRPGGTVYLDLDRGDTEIRSGRGSAVAVEIERIVETRSRDEARRLLEDHTYSWEQRGNDVYVTSRYEHNEGGWWNRWQHRDQVKIRILVEIPQRYHVDFTNGAGNVEVVSVEGRIQGRTGAGNIDIDEVTGSVHVSSGSGNVEIRDVLGTVEVHTGAGNVGVFDTRGALSIHTGAGNIEAEITGQPEEESRLESGAGNVTVFLADRIGVRVDATAGVGSASTDFPLEVEGKWMKRSFEGPVNGGGPVLRLRAGVGNVSLRKL